MDEDSRPDAPVADELLPLVAAGDASAFTRLFRRWRGSVYRFALHVIGCPAAADDVTQEVFLTVMREAARYEPARSSEIAWLLGIARNCARRRLQQDRPLVALDEGPADGTHAREEGADVLGRMIRSERLEELRRVIASLPLRYREAVVLCDLQEVSYADAARALDCPVGTVRSRLFRARALLASKLGAEDAGTDAAPRRWPSIAGCRQGASYDVS